MKCPKCQSKIEDNSNFCDQCGIEIFYQECVDCSATNRPIAKYCSDCGSKNLKQLPKETPEPLTDEQISRFF